MKNLLLASSLLLSFHTTLVSSADQTIVWSFDLERGRYPDVALKQGESINFVWDAEGFHDVSIHAANDCDTTGTMEIQADSLGPVTFSYMLDTTGDVYFACDVGSHCSAGGMLLRARVCGLFDRLLDGVIALFTFFIIRGECLLF